MVTVTKARNAKICVTAEENTSTTTDPTISETGSKGRCKVKGNWLTLMETLSMKGNGKMIIMKGKEGLWDRGRTGSSMKESLGEAKWKDLGKWLSMTAEDTKDSSETICLMARAECSCEMNKSKTECGNEALSPHSTDDLCNFITYIASKNHQ